MRRRTTLAWLACAGAVLAFAVPATGRAAPACDEYDPFGPSRTVQLRLGATDFTDEHGDELRSFIATESIGKVNVSIVSSSPRGVVRAVSAVPEVSMLSPYFGEQLKGINVAVSLAPSARPSRRPVTVTLSLRQVCAKHFRNTFLYY